MFLGTAEFAAPEVVLGQPVGFSTDLWSVGVLTYILLSGLSPFFGDSDEETLRNVKRGDWNMDDPAFDFVSADAKDFIAKCFVMDPAQRLSVKQALQHPWLSRVPDFVPPEGAGLPDPARFRQVQDSVRSRYVSVRGFVLSHGTFVGFFYYVNERIDF